MFKEYSYLGSGLSQSIRSQAAHCAREASKADKHECDDNYEEEKVYVRKRKKSRIIIITVDPMKTNKQ
jgi:hypothetical protein